MRSHKRQKREARRVGANGRSPLLNSQFCLYCLLLLASIAQGETFSISIPRYEIRDNRVRVVSTTGAEGFGSILETGRPWLPTRVVWIRIPHSAEDIKCKVIRSPAVLQETIPIATVPPIVLEGSSPLKMGSEKFKVKGDSIYPSRSGRYLELLEFRGQKFAKVMIFPFAYNLGTKELRWTPEIKIHLEYMSAPGETLLPEIITFEKISERYETTPYDYVMVVPQGLMGTVKEFAKWKETIGYKVTVISWDQIQEIDAPKYILAIGEPTETQNAKLETQNSIIGWIPYEEPHIVTSILERTIEFEINHKRKEILFVKGVANYRNEDFSGLPQEDKSTLLRELKSIVPSEWGYEEFTGEAIPSGYLVINFLTLSKNWLFDDGDGVPESHEIRVSNYLLGGDGTALVFAPFEGVEFLKEGAVCVVAPDSGASYAPGWKEPEDGGSQSFNYAFIKYLAEKKIVGDAFIQAKFWYESRFPQSASGGQEFKIWGDPALNLEGIPGIDGGITEMTEKWLPPDSAFSPVCVVHNFGRITEASCKIYCEIDSSGIPVYTSSIVLDTIQPMQAETVKFTEWRKYRTGVEYRVKFDLFSQSDENPENDTLSAIAKVAGGDFITSDTTFNQVLCGLGYKGVLVGTINELPQQWIKNFKTVFFSGADTSEPQIKDSANLYIEGDNLWLENLVQGKRVKETIVSPISGMSLSFACQETTFEWFIPHSYDTIFIDGEGKVCCFSYANKYKIWGTKFKLKEMPDTLKALMIDKVMKFFGVATDTSIKAEISEELSNIILFSCLPNPFSKQVNIKFRVQRYPTKLSLSVYNLAGNLVKKLIDDLVELGEYEFIWDGEDEEGNRVVNGIYFLRLQAEAEKKLVKLIVFR